MNKTAAMVVLAAILISGFVTLSALRNPAYAQTGKEMKVEIVSGATNKGDHAYAPNPVKVQPGTKVTWTNVDSALHTVTSGTASSPTSDFGSKADGTPILIAPKKTFSFTFDKAGTYDYYCTLHPAMVGKVVVDSKAPAISASSKDTSASKAVKIVTGATNKANKAYAPNPVKIKAGTTVVWKNLDSAIHTVTSGKDAKDKESGKMFDSKTVAPKKQFSFKFDKKGTFDYYCELHPAMVGKVVVK